MSMTVAPSQPTGTAAAPPPPWRDCFRIADATGAPVPDASIAIRQTDASHFRIGATITYVGKTGLEDKPSALRDPNGDLAAVLAQMKTVDDTVVGITDLASVPRPLLWLVPRYGAHTPAAVLHDRMIGKAPDGSPCPLHDWAADRFFRFMLAALGISPLHRYTMWTAVALRTRWKTGLRNQLLLLAWGALCAAGVALLVYGIVTGSAWAVAVSIVLPFAAALLFGKQYGAGLMWAVQAPIIVPPTVVVALTLALWGVEDRLIGN